MIAAESQYRRVWDEVQLWPGELRRWLADEIERSLESEPAADGAEWTDAKNARRCELIDKDLQRTITAAERRELSALTHQFRAHRRRVAPIPMAGAEKLHAALLERERAEASSGETA